MTTISQTEARRLKKRVQQLEAVLDAQRGAWSADYPGGVHIASEVGCNHTTTTAIKTARKLGHAVVAIQRTENEIIFYALPTPAPEDA